MNTLPDVNLVSGAATHKVDEAVGVQGQAGKAENRRWYVAIVNNRSERQCAVNLEKLGYECYVPTQAEIRRWRTGRRNIVERIILPTLVFIFTTEKERTHTVVRLPYIKRFMTDRAGSKDAFGRCPVAIIPQNQMDMLRFVLGHAESEVTIEPPPLRLGHKVRVFRGSLAGVEGYVDRMEDSNPKIFIRIDYLGGAMVEVDRLSIEMI